MALARRGGGKFETSIWPAFVDALTSLVLILMFVLSIFMIVQFTLREKITGQGRQLDDLTTQLSALTDVLALERRRSDGLEADLGAAQAGLAAREAEGARLQAALAAMAQARSAAEAQAAELAATLSATQSDLAAREAALATTQSDLAAREADLAGTRAALDAAAEAARLDAAKAATLEALVADLRARDQAAQADIARLTDADVAARGEIEKLTEAQARALALIAALETEKQATAQSLTQAELARATEAAAAQALRDRLAQSDTELNAMTLALEQARAQAEQTLTLLAAAEAAKRDQAATDAQALDRETALRQVAEAELAKLGEQSAEQARAVALLNAQTRELRAQLAALQVLLDDSARRDAAAQVQITKLGQDLNAALAQKVSDLARYRSEFLARVEQTLGGRAEFKRVGDRFVFQSEVLFDPASATLGPAGEAELAKLGAALREVSVGIPADVDWVLRVDGHTDRVPLGGQGRYRDNWELSQGRALSVVRYLIEREGVPPDRLAATGFGEFQPIAPGDDPASLAANRRIEFKFTER